MMTPNTGPEAEARKKTDVQLEQSGWIVQDRDDANIYAGQGVAVREFKMKAGHGYADYRLFIDQQTVGVWAPAAGRSGRRPTSGMLKKMDALDLVSRPLVRDLEDSLVDEE